MTTPTLILKASKDGGPSITASGQLAVDMAAAAAQTYKGWKISTDLSDTEEYETWATSPSGETFEACDEWAAREMIDAIETQGKATK